MLESDAAAALESKDSEHLRQAATTPNLPMEGGQGETIFPR